LELTATALCLNLNGLSLNFYDIITPDPTRLILVASGVVSMIGKWRRFAKDDLSPESFKHIEIMNNVKSVLL
jgi:hypothetical protein